MLDQLRKGGLLKQDTAAARTTSDRDRLDLTNHEFGLATRALDTRAAPNCLLDHWERQWTLATLINPHHSVTVTLI